MNLSVFLYFLFFILFILGIYFYWRYRLGEDANFQTLVQIIIALTIIMTVYSVYIQNKSHGDQVNSEEIEYFNSFFKDFLDEPINFFIENPEMNYYYDELFYGRSNYREEDRNKRLENQISMIMFSRMGGIIYYIQTYNADDSILGQHSDNIEQSNKKLLTILKRFFKSKIFNENWKIYKSWLASKWTIEYVKVNFNK